MIEEHRSAEEGHAFIGLDEIRTFLRRHALRLGACVAIGAILAMALTMIIQPLWQAKATVQNGQFYSSTTEPTAVSIESPARTVDRVKVASFQDSVLKQLNLPLEEGINAQTDLIRRSFVIRLLRNSDLLELSVRGYSPAEATRVLQQYVHNLTEEHRHLAQPTLDRMNEDLRQVQAELVGAQALQSDLEKRNKERNQVSAAGKFSENVLLDNMLSSNASDIRTLQQRRNILREQLNPERTFNTRMIGDTEVSREPVFPKRSLFVASGAMTGLLVGLAWIGWLASRRKSAKTR